MNHWPIKSNIEPLKTQKYSNEVNIDDLITSDETKEEKINETKQKQCI